MARGGKRKGAGRPKGTGKFGEPTKAIRLPVSMIDRIMGFIAQKGLVFPIYTSNGQVPSVPPAEGTVPETFDWVGYLSQNSSATITVRVADDSMNGAGILPNDILVVDKSAEPEKDSIVLAAVNGEFLLRHLVRKDGEIELRAANPAFAPAIVREEQELTVWGVVKSLAREI
ncbi:MAG: S24 family peptidase [Planctomycetaceae bacterium]|jgi:DNA polymerase V|nr:S24 family peptidase [Planctomycetaceae bacterium]